ncbi:hypothetical protein OG552_17780 [Streptomyces sp. NBC_01476]|uniref:hypothetical protein n=1 Tax=Streptomyces sp. NBC_01476 TaxID=2903881 RepID=UPI002E311E2A|nr:hypothetical protein [Streptomyces sp. NBC_01476]
MKRTVLVAALLCATTAGVLTGCNSSKDTAGGKPSARATTAPTTAPAPATTAPKGPLDGLSAQEISDKAVAAMKALSSVTVSGTDVEDGKPAELHLTVATSGKCLATVGEDGGTTNIISTLEYTYMKGNAAFWKAQGSDGTALGHALHGRWLKVKGNAASDPDFKAFCSLKTFMDSVTADDGGDKTKGAPIRLDGQTVIPITESGSNGKNVVYIADSAKPYALKIVDSGGTDGDGSLDFSGFDKPLHVYAPPPSETVSESSLVL